MATAIPKKARPHKPGQGRASRIQSLKEQLIQHVIRGDQGAAETMRQELRVEQLKKQALQHAANSPNSPGASSANWLGPDGEHESIELTATPEARAYFEQVMSKEEA